MIGTAKYLFGLSVGLIALLCFAAGAVIDRRPDVPRAPPPDAQEVRAALGFGQMALILMGTSSPVSFTLPQAWLDGVHSLVSHGKDNLAMDGRIDGRGAVFRVSKRLTRHGWLNLAFRLEETSAGGAPRLILYAGGWRAPEWLTAALLRMGLPLLGGSQELESLIPAFRAEDQTVQMTARVPRALVGGLQAVLGSGEGGGVDLELVRAIYGELLAGAVLEPEPDYARIVRRAAMQVDSAEGLKAALVALTMFTDGPRVLRLAGDRTKTPPCALTAFATRLHGRADTPKHWVLSAALTMFMDEKTGRAIGLWKELDDSLPGGSGFSFVDLAADMAGVRIGKAARDGTDIDKVIAGLRSGRPEIILPSAVLQLPEALPHHQWKRRYGPLEERRMMRQERLIGDLLDRSPLYSRLPPSNP